MANTKHLGFEGKLYYAVVPGTGTTPAVTKLVHISGYTLNIKANEVNANDHDSGGWGDKLAGYKEWTADVEVLYVDGAATQSALLAACTNGSTINVEFRNVDNVGGDNRTGQAVIVDFGETVKGEAAQTQTFKLSGRGPLVPGTVASS